MALIRELVSGEMFSTANKEPVKCAACKNVAEYQKVGVMEGVMEVCRAHRWRSVWKVRGMRGMVPVPGRR